MNGLLFITHRTEKITYLQSVEIALKGGCRQIQLRMKEAEVDEVEATAQQAKSLCDEYHAKLYIDDHVDVCKKAEATGVHLGKSDMLPVNARTVLGDRYIIGGTANTFEDIVELYKQKVDYIGLGPFRFTMTKKNISPVLGLEGYEKIVNKCRDNNINIPILAIGGITINDIHAIMSTGVSGIALSSTILNAEDPIKETERIIKIMGSLNSCGGG